MGGAVKQEEEEAQMDSFRASAETRAGMERAALGEKPRQVRNSRENKPMICLGSFSDVKSADPVSLALLQTQQLVLGTLLLSCLPRS